MGANTNLAGRCGMYCGACEIHRAYKDGGRMRQEVARKHNCLPGDVRCDGCRAVHIVGWSRVEDFGRNCAILHCLKTKSLDSCHDCGTASQCERWTTLAEELMQFGIDLRANLTAIQMSGIESWVRNQEERWACQKCSRPVNALSDSARCHLCGCFQL
jgi:hypothetical protein